MAFFFPSFKGFYLLSGLQFRRNPPIWSGLVQRHENGLLRTPSEVEKNRKKNTKRDKEPSVHAPGCCLTALSHQSPLLLHREQTAGGLHLYRCGQGWSCSNFCGQS